MHHHNEPLGQHGYAQQQPTNYIKNRNKRYPHNTDKHLYLPKYIHWHCHPVDSMNKNTNVSILANMRPPYQHHLASHLETVMQPNELFARETATSLQFSRRITSTVSWMLYNNFRESISLTRLARNENVTTCNLKFYGCINKPNFIVFVYSRRMITYSVLLYINCIVFIHYFWSRLIFKRIITGLVVEMDQLNSMIVNKNE